MSQSRIRGEGAHGERAGAREDGKPLRGPDPPERRPRGRALPTFEMLDWKRYLFVKSPQRGLGSNGLKT